MSATSSHETDRAAAVKHLMERPWGDVVMGLTGYRPDDVQRMNLILAEVGKLPTNLLEEVYKRVIDIYTFRDDKEPCS